MHIPFTGGGCNASIWCNASCLILDFNFCTPNGHDIHTFWMLRKSDQWKWSHKAWSNTLYSTKTKLPQFDNPMYLSKVLTSNTNNFLWSNNTPLEHNGLYNNISHTIMRYVEPSINPYWAQPTMQGFPSKAATPRSTIFKVPLYHTLYSLY